MRAPGKLELGVAGKQALSTYKFGTIFDANSNSKQTRILVVEIVCAFNSLGHKFSSQGHFHSLQLLNVPQFLFSRLVRLKTAPRGNFSHA